MLIMLIMLFVFIDVSVTPSSKKLCKKHHRLLWYNTTMTASKVPILPYMDSHGVGLDVLSANIQVVINSSGITEEVAHVPVATLKWASMGGCFASIWKGFWGMFYG